MCSASPLHPIVRLHCTWCILYSCSALEYLNWLTFSFSHSKHVEQRLFDVQVKGINKTSEEKEVKSSRFQLPKGESLESIEWRNWEISIHDNNTQSSRAHHLTADYRWWGLLQVNDIETRRYVWSSLIGNYAWERESGLHQSNSSLSSFMSPPSPHFIEKVKRKEHQATWDTTRARDREEREK